jgi:hypothetical protein
LITLRGIGGLVCDGFLLSPGGLGGVQQAPAAAPGWCRSVYRLVVHPQTLPAISKSPYPFGGNEPIGERPTNGADKGVDRHRFRHVGDVPAEHLADAEVAEEDRRAERDQAQALGLQIKDMARNMGVEDRRVLAPGKIPLLLADRGARQHADIAAREQGFETGDGAGEQAGLDHPEHRLVGQQRLGLPGGDGHDEMGVVGGKLQAVDRAEDDVFELELRLSGLQPLGSVEGDGDRRPLLRQGVSGKLVDKI